MSAERRRRLGALLIVGLVLAALGGASEAQTAVESGWWWKGNPGASAPLPSDVPKVDFPAAPPGFPPPPNAGDGLMVAALPDGAFSIAAVKAEADAQSITLTPVENGDFGGESAHLLACMTTGDWKAEAGGRWDNKPVVACDLANGGGSVAGIRGEDGTWVFPVQPLVQDGQIDFAIVPTAGPLPEELLEPFQLVFKVPTIESFVVNPPVSAVDEPEEYVEPPTPEEFGDDEEAFDFTEIVGDESFAPVVSPALPPAAQAPALVTPAAVTAPSHNSGAQSLALLILLLVAGAAWMTSRQPLPAPVSLTRVGARTRTGPVVPPSVGGLGRFERTRSGKPPSLF